MNTRRIAALLRRRAEIDLELADAFEDGAANDAAPPKKPKRLPPMPLVPPVHPPTDIDRQRAKQDLRRLPGYRVKP